NARKFTDRGGGVRIELRAGPIGVVLTVADTGVGIAPEVLEQLFVPFVQAPQTLARSRGGLGIGLAMVKALVELHGGSVRIDSPGVGKGTIVTLWLPLATGVLQQPAASKQSRAQARRVLVIEDNHDVADSLRIALALGGHQVEVAYDGASGIALARAFRPHLVICDIGLPGMDGYAVAQALRTDVALRDTYLAALTGYARPDDVRRAAD